MRELIVRILNALTAVLFRRAEQLARLAAVRHVASEYEAAYAEARALEASGNVRLAEALRAELDEVLEGGSAVEGEATPLSLNGAVTSDPFGLPGPKALAGTTEASARASEVAQANGQPEQQQARPRRRGRSRSTNGRKKRAKRTAKREAEEGIVEAQTTSATLTGV